MDLLQQSSLHRGAARHTAGRLEAPELLLVDRALGLDYFRDEDSRFCLRCRRAAVRHAAVNELKARLVVVGDQLAPKLGE